jgi:DNA-binding CsgD family transcriptional regulator
MMIAGIKFPITLPDGREVLLEDVIAASRDSLSPKAGRNERIIYLRAQGVTLTEIGLEFGINPERVRQIAAKIVRMAGNRTKIGPNDPCAPTIKMVVSRTPS